MSRDNTQRRILNWLDAIAPVPDIQSYERPCKRLRLDTDEHAHNKYSGLILNGGRTRRLRTPPGSGSLLSKLSDTPPARRTNQADSTDDEGQEHAQVSGGLPLQVELTPRPARQKASVMDNGSLTSGLPSILSRSSSKTSSNASKITRNSSPTKQLRNAELEETGFLRADLCNDTKPESLDALTADLEKIISGFGILPRDLQDDVRTHSCESWIFPLR